VNEALVEGLINGDLTFGGLFPDLTIDPNDPIDPVDPTDPVDPIETPSTKKS
jgi:hypothetical protein